jgi:hypothetical protein
MLSCELLDNLNKYISIINPPIIEGISGVKHQFYLIGKIKNSIQKEEFVVVDYCEDEQSLLQFFIKSIDVKSKLKIAICKNITEEMKKFSSLWNIFLIRSIEDIIKVIKENL